MASVTFRMTCRLFGKVALLHEPLRHGIDLLPHGGAQIGGRTLHVIPQKEFAAFKGELVFEQICLGDALTLAGSGLALMVGGAAQRLARSGDRLGGWRRNGGAQLSLVDGRRWRCDGCRRRCRFFTPEVGLDGRGIETPTAGLVAPPDNREGRVCEQAAIKPRPGPA